MSYTTLASQGLAALESRDWDEAINKLSTALQSSQNPAWLIARSKALIQIKRYQEALQDAELAWHCAYDRNKRPSMVDAHHRRAVAYYRLGKFADADCCCIYAMRLLSGLPACEKEDPVLAHLDAEGQWTATLADAKAEAIDEIEQSKKEGGVMGLAMGSDSQSKNKEWRAASTLRLQALKAMEKLPPNDPARKPSASQKPPKKSLKDVTQDKNHESKEKSTPDPTAAVKKQASGTIQAAPRPPVPSDTPVRLQEFQNDTTMSVSIFSKGVKKEELNVEMLPFSVSLDPIVWPSGEEKGFTLNLWGEIDPVASKYTVTPSKVELSLKKKESGKWAQLQGEAKESSSAAIASSSVPTQRVGLATNAGSSSQLASEKANVANAVSSDTGKPKMAAKSGGGGDDSIASASGPSYPSSARSGPKNWDSIGADEGGEDDEQEGDVNFFFKKLYKNATPEQQRAMMKSFTESNGTSLSTDWNDVKGRTVETVPPEGLEAKKWS